MFTGFPEGTEQFFLDIRFHNNADYFHSNIERYRKEVQAPFYELIEDLVPSLLDVDSQMETRPYKIISRLRRDTRFTKDKTPYRDHLWTYFHRAAEPKESSLGFWFEFGPGRLAWGMGSWGENRPLMERMRREFAAKPTYYWGLIHGCGLAQKHLELHADLWKRMEVPKNIPPALEPWYRIRNFSIMQMFPDLREASSRDLFLHVRSDFQAMAPIYKMLRGMQDELDKELLESQEKLQTETEEEQ